MVRRKEVYRFAPEDYITRAEIVKILAHLSGGVGETKSVFFDVSAGTWCADAVGWGADRGIVTGRNGMFYPLSPITHQEMAVILERCVQKVAEAELAGKQETIAYKDNSTISIYVEEAVAAMQNAGIVVSGGHFGPKIPSPGRRPARCFRFFWRSSIKQEVHEMKTSTTLQVEGIHCPKCMARVQEAAKEMELFKVSVSADWKKVTFAYEDVAADKTTLEKIIERAGFKVV